MGLCRVRNEAILEAISSGRSQGDNKRSGRNAKRRGRHLEKLAAADAGNLRPGRNLWHQLFKSGLAFFALLQ